ncbi:putative enzyme related to lactoylglutathione lyase [Nocardioides luteus]|uniref:Glyoxalase/bleomycin resistance protein n=1 Tax=Nocardioides luteus TaxID=1844 RepID=A0ABQ5T0R5_9ACTN|nr:VOC family protein [Nocardioides luteus]MDR7310555.1 putative enzyme related to lactoylglutathione lyase [Nocardioides luteus]GGR42050.1 putative glyoxalase/bleomycin resistance protein [Nocardioides luteus]GLJ69664.1 putative glyoxalase/bleomycin resistance protein [Nocardioides luteus]
MDIKISFSYLPHNDPEASLRFYRDLLGFEVRKDVGYESMRWLTIGPPSQRDISIVLYPPLADPNISEAEGQVVLEMMAKGTFASLMLSSPDVDAAFEKIQAGIEGSGGEIMSEPTDQDWGMRDCSFRDPAGNTVRLQQIG